MTGSKNEVISIKADPLRPAHPPKTTGEQFSNTFTCDALTSSGNESVTFLAIKGRPTLTQTVMAKQRLSLI